MTRPTQKQTHQNHEGNCKLCGHKTKAGYMVAISHLNKQYEGKVVNMCPKCKSKAHAGRNGARFVIEKLGFKDFAADVQPQKVRKRFGRVET